MSKQKKCFCCKQIKKVTSISSSSDGKGTPHIVCKECNHIEEK